MKSGDKVQVIDIDTSFKEESRNWMSNENRYAHLRDKKRIKNGDIIEVSEFREDYSFLLKYPVVKLDGYVYWHTIKRFKLL